MHCRQFYNGCGGEDSSGDSATGVNFLEIIFSPSIAVLVAEDAPMFDFSSLRCW